MNKVLENYIDEFIIEKLDTENFVYLNEDLLYFTDHIGNELNKLLFHLVDKRIISSRYSKDITRLKKLLEFVTSEIKVLPKMNEDTKAKMSKKLNICINYRIYLIENKLSSKSKKNTDFLRTSFTTFLKKNYSEIEIRSNKFLYKPDKIDLRVVESLDDFINQHNILSANSDNLFYRGHANIDWQLIPSIYRNNWIESEDKMFRETLIRNPEEFQNTKSSFERLTIMQHYGLPTRLLDITKNPLVSLYFACCEKDEINSPGEIILFNPSIDIIKFYDSDKVCIFSNLAKCERNLSLKSKTDFNTKYTEGLKLLHLIKEDKPHFTNNIDPLDFTKTLIVKPINNNNRIKRQSGYFFIFGFVNNIKKPAKIDCRLKINNKEIKLIIENSCKGKILKQLDNLNINSESLFPEIERGTEYIKNKYL
jgi:hypothetical protein